MDVVQIKKQKLTENSIQVCWPVDVFRTQYKTCMLLLAHGIPGLPYDLVYLIVKEYVYVKPLRIGLGCSRVMSVDVNTGESIVYCEHDMPDLALRFPRRPRGNVTVLTYWTNTEIVAWFEKHHFQVPEHFLPK